MKRSAAIVGPTPPFVRWAIRFDCPYRENENGRIAWQTFRQLRSLREVSNGRLDARILQGICIDAERNQSAKTAYGFPVDEVMAFYGTFDEVDSHCGGCPANALIGQSETVANRCRFTPWAGCYGILPANTGSCDLPSAFNRIDTGTDRCWSVLPPARSIWFRLWQIESWDGASLRCLRSALEEASLIEPNLLSFDEFVHLNSAVVACLENDLVLETELFPRGMSDGLHWTIEPHCRTCKSESGSDHQHCAECGDSGPPVRLAKRKVLGRRPFLRLVDLIGQQETERLLDLYRSDQSTQ